MILDKHWWRAPDGHLVPEDGDVPNGSTLAYTRGQDVPDNLARKAGLLKDYEPKQQPRPADKMAAKPADKAAPKRPPASGPGSGIDAWRAYAAEVSGEPVESLADLSRDELIALVE